MFPSTYITAVVLSNKLCYSIPRHTSSTPPHPPTPPPHPSRPSPNIRGVPRKSPHPCLPERCVQEERGSLRITGCLSAQQTHSSALNPSILRSQGFPPEIPAPDKRNTPQKKGWGGPKFSSSSSSSSSPSSPSSPSSSSSIFSSLEHPPAAAQPLVKSVENSHQKQNTQGSKSHTGRDGTDGRLIMSLLHHPHASESCRPFSCSQPPSVHSYVCDDRELICTRPQTRTQAHTHTHTHTPPTGRLLLTRAAEGSSGMTALSALGRVPPLRSCADSVSLSPLSNALSRESVSEREAARVCE